MLLGFVAGDVAGDAVVRRVLEDLDGDVAGDVIELLDVGAGVGRRALPRPERPAAVHGEVEHDQGGDGPAVHVDTSGRLGARMR